VKKMTFDNEDELAKIAAEHPGAELILRILTDDSASVCRLGLKFGAPLERVPALLATAQALRLNVIGVS
jgi:diaminopimelate decarboxylase